MGCDLITVPLSRFMVGIIIRLEKLARSIYHTTISYKSFKEREKSLSWSVRGINLRGQVEHSGR